MPSPVTRVIKVAVEILAGVCRIVVRLSSHWATMGDLLATRERLLASSGG